MLNRVVINKICEIYSVPEKEKDIFYSLLEMVFVYKGDIEVIDTSNFINKGKSVVEQVIYSIFFDDIKILYTIDLEKTLKMAYAAGNISLAEWKEFDREAPLLLKTAKNLSFIKVSKKIFYSKKWRKKNVQPQSTYFISDEIDKFIDKKKLYIYNVIWKTFFENLYINNKQSAIKSNIINFIIGYVLKYNLEKTVCSILEKKILGIMSYKKEIVHIQDKLMNKKEQTYYEIKCRDIFINKIPMDNLSEREYQYIVYLTEHNPNKNIFIEEIKGHFEEIFLNNIDGFIWKLKMYSYFIHANFVDKLQLEYLISLKDTFKKRIVNLNNEQILVSVLIQDIWDTCTNDTNYNVNERLERLRNNSQKYFLQYVEKDPSYIQNIANPSFALQKLAIEKDAKAINYIKKLDDRLCLRVYKDKAFADYVKEHQKEVDNAILMNTKLEVAKFVESADDGMFMVLNNDIPFDCYIKAIFNLYVVEKCYIATGYTFASGLHLLNDELLKLLENNGELRFIVGSLQHYPDTKDLIQGMDKQTAKSLNDLLAANCRLRTCTTNFYHGKIYFIQTENFSITIMGSTNFSRTAFQRNKELDTLFYYKDNSQNPFIAWLNDFWNDCTEIAHLDESHFSDIVNPNAELESDLETISIDEMKNRISSLSNEEMRQRLSCWLQYEPSNIFDHVDVAGKKYIAIEYLSRNLIVLESFFEGNAYYAFHDTNIQEILTEIKGKTKTQIAKLPKKAERRYHIQDIDKIKLNIKVLFMNNPAR